MLFARNLDKELMALNVPTTANNLFLTALRVLIVITVCNLVAKIQWVNLFRKIT